MLYARSHLRASCQLFRGRWVALKSRLMGGNELGAWDTFGSVFLLVYRPAASLHAAAFDELLSALGKRSDLTAIVLRTNNVVPTHRQRAGIQLLLKRRRLRSAILTDSLLIRGVTNAFSWVGLPAQAFAEHDLEGALTYAGIEPGRLEDAKRAYHAVAASLVQERRSRVS